MVKLADLRHQIGLALFERAQRHHAIFIDLTAFDRGRSKQVTDPAIKVQNHPSLIQLWNHFQPAGLKITIKVAFLQRQVTNARFEVVIQTVIERRIHSQTTAADQTLKIAIAFGFTADHNINLAQTGHFAQGHCGA
ncbi:Uncharacterised protein [Vibrio cholerae]|nr:Uncharacterised protein [Vibrio cholerae]